MKQTKEKDMNTLADIAKNRNSLKSSKTVLNNCGKVVHAIDEMDHLRRFLIIGTDGSSYYVNQKTISLDALGNVAKLFLSGRGAEVIMETADVLSEGRSRRSEACLIVLALGLSFGCASKVHSNAIIQSIIKGNGNESYERSIRSGASIAIMKTVNTPTDLFTLMNYVRQFRGTGSLVRDTLNNWLAYRNDDRLALQAVKYRQRNGWTLRDILRVSHYKVGSDATIRRALIDWIAHRDNVGSATLRTEVVGGKKVVLNKDNRIQSEHKAPKQSNVETLAIVRENFPVINGYYLANEATSIKDVVNAVERNGLPWECVPDQWLREVPVWEALINDIGAMALVRNLGRLGSINFFNSSANTKAVCNLLTNENYIQKSRIHPFAIFAAYSVYKKGRGSKGSLTWTVNNDVLNALDSAFFLAFKNVKATGKLIMQGIDISGSMWGMSWNRDTQGDFTAAEAAAAVALITARVEAEAGRAPTTLGFTNTLRDFGKITSKSTLKSMDAKMREMSRHMGSTDARLLINYATQHNIAVEAFVLYTDNEQNGYGHKTVTDCLEEYRRKTGIQARLVSVAFTATNFSVADAKDPLQLDIVGFDASAPALLSSFISGEF